MHVCDDTSPLNPLDFSQACAVRLGAWVCFSMTDHMAIYRRRDCLRRGWHDGLQDFGHLD